MDKSITIVVSSKKMKDEKKDLIDNIANTCGCRADILFITNPDGVGLSKIYNTVLKDDGTNEIILFIHDDIEFLKDGWGNEIISLFEKYKQYGIIGVAGSAEFDENGAWWNYKRRYGQVMHKHDGKSWLTQFSPLLKEDLKEVCVIDGLFIAVNKKRISKMFDEKFNFHFYDIAFCLANYFDKKTKIGVTTNIRISHNSIGELNEEWYKNRDIIVDMYQDKFPVSVYSK